MDCHYYSCPYEWRIILLNGMQVNLTESGMTNVRTCFLKEVRKESGIAITAMRREVNATSIPHFPSSHHTLRAIRERLNRDEDESGPTIERFHGGHIGVPKQ